MSFAFLPTRTKLKSDESPFSEPLLGEQIFLRTPQQADYIGWSELRAKSRAFLEPWEPIWAEDDLTRNGFRRRLRRYQQEHREDQAYALFIFRQADQQLLGGLTLSNIRRGICQTCSLGYWMGAPFAGQGYMSAAVRAVLPFAFETLGLHRVEAASIPHNTRSVGLLKNIGFQEEGHARKYLCINGNWQDHTLFAILKEDLAQNS